MQLIWFRQDLRIHDQTALWQATQAGPCIALAIRSPAQSALHQDAQIKNEFYLRRLQQLKLELQSYNIPLIVQEVPLWKDIPAILLQLAQQLHVDALHANIEVGVNELSRDLQVQTLLEKNGIVFNLYHDRTLFPLATIRNQSGQPYQVFSAFKKKCYEHLSLSLPQCYPPIQAQAPLPPHDLWDSTLVDGPIADSSIFADAASLAWSVNETEVLGLLDDFIEHQVQYYHQERDFPALDSTSRLSPYLNIGMLSIRQSLQALFRAQQGHFHIEHPGQQTWLDELLWREFYLHTLFDFPKLSKHAPFKDSTRNIPWRDAPEDLAAWQQGETGIPIVDAGMRQMLATGWMHNRVRMITAMFLSKNLLIDWRLGEAWFMQHLIDGDLAANNGGWQWCASTGMDAVPYFRIFNPISQSQKFDHDGNYIRQWVPELAHLDAKTIHEPYAKNPDLRLDYPKPIVDLKSSRVRAIEAFKNS